MEDGGSGRGRGSLEDGGGGRGRGSLEGKGEIGGEGEDPFLLLPLPLFFLFETTLSEMATTSCSRIGQIEKLRKVM